MNSWDEFVQPGALPRSFHVSEATHKSLRQPMSSAESTTRDEADNRLHLLLFLQPRQICVVTVRGSRINLELLFDDWMLEGQAETVTI